MAQPKFDLIVFDYDGVVADSELLNNRVLVDLLNGIGLPTTLDYALSHYMGRRWDDIAPMIGERLGQPCHQHLRQDWFDRCHSRTRTELKSVTGFDHFLRHRTEQVCIASSSPPPWIDIGLSLFGTSQPFENKIFSGAVHVDRGKPHPDLFLYAAHTLEVAPQRSLVIEDSPAGVTGGVAAGMTVVGLCAGGHIRDGHAETLKAAGAHHVFDSYAQIEHWLGT